MKHLTEDELSKLRASLEAKQKDLTEQLSRLGKKDPSTGEWRAEYKDIGEDWDDNVHEVQNFSDASSIEASLSKHLENVKGAIARIEDGTYGICSVGGEEIERERLLVTPETGVCSKHAS